MAVLPDRPQGGSSLKTGHVELMVHRWHTTNDNLGNGESLAYPEALPLLHRAVARGTHHVFLGSAAETRDFLRPYSLQLVYRPLVAFAAPEFTARHGDQFSWLQSALPRTVHLLTLEQLSQSEVLLRLEHLAIEQRAVQVNVTRLLRGFRLRNVRPVTLAANQFLPGPTRHRWETQPQKGWHRQAEQRLAAPTITSKLATGDKIVSLSPGQIASLVAEIYEPPASPS
ncbi:lysosomal alpha-mannosidase-like [Haemaphysalis longicornis]